MSRHTYMMTLHKNKNRRKDMTCGECDNWRTTGRIETCCGVRLGFCRPQGHDVEKEEDARACKQFRKART